MAWSPQARKAAALARKRKSGGRRKPQYGVARNGKKMTPAQRKKAGATRSGARNASKSARNSKRNARLDKKIRKTRAKTNKKVTKYAKRAEANAYTHSTQGGLYFNARGVKAFKKGAKAHVRGQKRIKKLKSKKRR